MNMPGRTFSAGTSYRYGFNGKELDKEVAGTTTYDYGFRIYNPALGKFLSVDPLTKSYPFYTPYQYASNTPIVSIDIDGLEGDKELNPTEIKKKGVENFFKLEVSSTQLLFHLYVQLNPYTRVALSIVQKATKPMVKEKAVLYHLRAEEVDKKYQELQNYFHGISFYGLEENMYEKRIDNALDYNLQVGTDEVSLGVPLLADKSLTDDFNEHEKNSHNSNQTSNSNKFTYYETDFTLEQNNFIKSKLKEIEKTKQNLKNAKKEYIKFSEIYLTCKDLSSTKLAENISSYFSDIFDWNSDEGKKIKESLNKLTKNSSSQDKEKVMNTMINQYLVATCGQKQSSCTIITLGTIK